MKTVFTKTLAITFFVFLCTSAAFATEPDDILLASDKSYLPQHAKMRMLMRSYQDDEQKREYEFEVFFKGSDRYLLIVKNPPIMRKQVQMRVDDTIWNYLGKIKRMRRISARAMFLDTTFTQEDIMYSTLSRLYSPVSMDDAKINGKDCYALTLSPKSKENTYAKIVAYIDKKDFLPVRRVYYSYGGEAVKQLDIVKIDKKDSRTTYIELIVKDLIRKGISTRVIFDNIDEDYKITDKMFTPEYMQYVAR